MEFGDFSEFFGTVGFQELFGGGVDGFGGAFGKGKAVLFFQFSDPSEEFAPSDDGGGGYGDVCFRFVSLFELDFFAGVHDGVFDDGFALGKLVAEGKTRRRRHLAFSFHEVFNGAGVSPGEEAVESHAFVMVVVFFVADGHDGRDAAGRLDNLFGELSDLFVRRNLFGVLDAFCFEDFDDGFVDVDSGHAKGTEEVAFAAFVDAQPRG